LEISFTINKRREQSGEELGKGKSGKGRLKNGRMKDEREERRSVGRRHMERRTGSRFSKAFHLWQERKYWRSFNCPNPWLSLGFKIN
jgi:hypothetical protein